MKAWHIMAVWAIAAAGLATAAADKTASLDEVVASKADLWGEAALRQPAGPTYEFFEKLLPPPRYVHADFRHYPLVLGAPSSKVKARLISNGSGVNLAGGSRSWHVNGIPITFRVGPDELRFGEYPFRLDGPHLLDGYLPIVEIKYTHGEAVYRQEVFASVDPALAELGVVLAQFSLAGGSNGAVAIQIDAATPLRASQGRLEDDKGRAVLFHDGGWTWTRERLVAQISPRKTVRLAIPTKLFDGEMQSPLASGGYRGQREKAMETWQNLLHQGMFVSTPEPVVQNAWRTQVLGIHALINGNRMHYSAGNQYDRLYQAEGCDAVDSLLLWGFEEDIPRLALSQLQFTRKGLEYHQAGHKLQLLADYFWRTRDADFLRAQESYWKKEVDLIVRGRTNEHGLFPREQYCGDVATPVFSLNSNAKCWRGLRDFGVVLDQIGQKERARDLLRIAAEFRDQIVAAVAHSERKDSSPTFIPIALFGEEEPYDPITGTKIGSYWNLMANYVVASGVFGPNSARETALLEYVREKGGLSMGLIRSRPSPTFWTGLHSINPLYGLRRVLTLLRRDEADQALVAFYGMLAQGLTRETFNGGEGCSLTPLDEGGRLFYCPPNSAANAFFLTMLRTMLVQDFDLSDDGTPETLRLFFATPRAWLADGKSIRIERAPTAFGEISAALHSRIERGELTAEVDLPRRSAPAKTLLRARLPAGYQIVTARVGERELRADPSGAVDLSGLSGKITIQFSVRKL